MQRQARSITKTFTISGAFAIAALATTSASVTARSGCTNQIVYPTIPASQSEDCGSYTDCEANSQCLTTGGRFESCGPLQSFNRYCFDYIGGTFNEKTGRCEGGTWVGPAYEDSGTQVLIYTQPQYCGTPFPA
jgi:hypothetical protein